MAIITGTGQLRGFALEDAAHHYDAIRRDGQDEAHRQGRPATVLEHAIHLAEAMRVLYRNESFCEMFG